MAKVGIFYGTDTGSTRKVAKLIQQAFGEDLAAAPKNINQVQDASEWADYDYLVLGTPTAGEGLLPGLDSECSQESWDEFLPNFEDLDLSGKTVALFGLGDQVNYGEMFVDALGELYDYVAECGPQIVGRWPLDGYEFEESSAVDEDEFVGLVIDKDNQANLTESRVTTWVAQIKQEMGL